MLSVNGVVAHIELEYGGYGFLVGEFHRVQTHLRADEMDELFVGNLSETLEPGDLDSCLELGYGLFLFLGVVAVDVGLLVLHPEERGLEYVHVPAPDEVGVVLEEEGEDQHPDVHSVIIGIGSHDDVVVAQVLKVVFNAQRRDEQVELFVFRHLLSALLVAVDRLASQGKYGLEVGVPRLGDGTARGVALGDEDGRVLYVLLVLLGNLVIEVETAVPELLVVDIGLLVALAGLLLYARNLHTLGLGCLDLVLQNRHHILVYAQVVVQVLGHEVVDVGAYGRTRLVVHHAVGVRLLPLPHIGGPELGLGLAFEVGLLNLYAYGSDHALTEVGRLVVLLEELLESLGNGFPVCREVGASVAGILAVDEGGDVLAVGVAVAEHYLYVLAHQVNRRIERGFAEVLVHQVEQAVFGLVSLPVEYQGQSLLEVGVVLDHSLDIVRVEGEVSEHQLVGNEAHQGAVLLGSRTLAAALELPALKTGPGALAVAVRTDVEAG